MNNCKARTCRVKVEDIKICLDMENFRIMLCVNYQIMVMTF